jgi:hypothetical protein
LSTTGMRARRAAVRFSFGSLSDVIRPKMTKRPDILYLAHCSVPSQPG